MSDIGHFLLIQNVTFVAFNKFEEQMGKIFNKIDKLWINCRI